MPPNYWQTKVDGPRRFALTKLSAVPDIVRRLHQFLGLNEAQRDITAAVLLR